MPSPSSHDQLARRADDIGDSDPGDEILDQTGEIDWHDILATTEPDRLAGRLIPIEEFIRRSLDDADAIGRMSPAELDALLADDGTD